VALILVVLVLWQLLAPSPPVERIRVAVVPFANQTEEDLEKVRLMLTHMLLLELAASPNIQVFPYDRLLEITRGIESEGKDISSPEAIRAVVDYSDARFVVVPAMHAIGNTVMVSAEFRDTQTGESVGSTKAERSRSGSAEDTLYSMLGDLAEGIQKQFQDLGGQEEYQPLPQGRRPRTASAAIQLNEGQNAFAQGDYGRALDSFQRVVEEDPSYALAHAWMGQIYGLLGHDDRARAVSEQATRLISPHTPINEAYFIEANLAERRYDFSAAEQKYLELIRLYANDPVWHYHLARIYGQQGLYAKALNSYQEALHRDSKYIVAYQHLGTLYSRTRDYDQALSHTQKALNLYRALRNREGEARALLDLANIFRLRRNIQEAKSSAELALQLFASLENQFGVLEATKRLGDAYFSEGELKQARQYYEHVLAETGSAILRTRSCGQQRATQQPVGGSHHDELGCHLPPGRKLGEGHGVLRAQPSPAAGSRRIQGLAGVAGKSSSPVQPQRTPHRVRA
jgi:tetratricopeptide (TPR) repeat protein